MKKCLLYTFHNLFIGTGIESMGTISV